MDNIFDIDNFNIIEDEENYYFFRALNKADSKDIEEKRTTDENGNIERIRTDRQRYEGEAKYKAEDTLSLEEVFDHIKMHYRKDTNCVSLSSNANVSISYGRGFYNDEYAMIKVPKKEFGQKVIYAGQYMLEEIEKRINDFLASNQIDEKVLDDLERIEKSQNAEELKEISICRRYSNYGTLKGTITARKSIDQIKKTQGIVKKRRTIIAPEFKSSNYKALNSKQLLEKNRIIAKLTVLEKNAHMPLIIPRSSNNSLLIQTIGNAFSSMEQLHYGEVEKEEISKISKEEMDIFSLIQQVQGVDEKVVRDLKREVLNYVLSGKPKDVFNERALDRDFNLRDDISIDDMYELTDGRVDFGISNRIVRDMFYLSRAQLNAREYADILNSIVENNPKYKDVIEYIKSNGFTIEPEIITRKSNKGEKISESVSLDIKDEEIELKDKILELEDQELLKIIEDGGLSSVKNIMNDTFAKRRREEIISKEEYYAEAMLSLYEWRSLGIEEFTIEERTNLINRIKKRPVIELYKKIEEAGIERKDIPTVLMNIITRDNKFTIEENDTEETIKEKTLNQYDDLIANHLEEVKDKIFIERIERFLGYYDVENTNIKLRPYQLTAVENVNEIFEDNKFSSVILPTGGGKTFVALAELIEFQKKNEELIKQGKEPKKMLYLAPQNEILEQVKDDIIKYIHGKKGTIGKTKDEIIKEVFPELEFATYSSLLSKEGEKLINQKYGFIVLDELHRTGAKEWGEKLDKLLDNQDEDVKVLGITATPRRDSDGKDMSIKMAERLGYTNQEAVAGKHIAMNMSLTNAIRMGLVVNPKLVSCEYNLLHDEDFIKVKGKIDSISDINLRNEKIEEYESLRRNLEKSKGISQILKGNIKPGGRYMVFLPVSEQLEDEDGNPIGNLTGKEKITEYEKQIREYLQGTGINPSFHSMLGEYGNKENQRRLDEFQSDANNDTKFMLVMNKANEGLHLDKLNGMIWLRPMDENSRILYLQQLGRVIYSEDPDNPTKDEDRPVVIDLVNNTLKVNWDEEVTSQDDIEILNLIINWSNTHNGILPDIDSKDKEEKGYAKVLKEIKNKYQHYLEEDFENLEEKQIEEINTIIALGENIDLWQIDLSENSIERTTESNKKSNVSSILEYFEIKGFTRSFVELKNAVNAKINLTGFEEVLEFCKKNGRIPQFSSERSIYRKWSNSKEKKIVDKYIGTPLKEIPEEHRKLVEQMRKYGGGITPFDEVLEFCKKNGRLPQARRESSLYDKWRKSEEKKIVDKYIGKPLEEIPEEHRKLVEQMRNYGGGIEIGLNTFEEVLEFCKKNGRLPQGKSESSLYDKWRKSEEKKIVDKYKGKSLEEIPEEHRKLVEQMRKYGVGKGTGLINFEEVLEFCKKNGRLPQSKSESSLYEKWHRSEEKKIVDKYKGKEVKEIPEEHRKLVELMRNYGAGIGTSLTPFEEVLEFCKKNGRIPQFSSERSIYRKWSNSKEKKIVDKYIGTPLKEIPEEHRKLVEQMRKYGGGITPFDEVLEFCKKNGRLPQDRRESSLYDKWRKSEEKKIVDKYKGKEVKEIPEEHRKLVELMRNYGAGIGTSLTPFEEVLEFCKKNGRLPQGKSESSLYEKWKKSEEKKIVDKYKGKEVKEIPEEHRKLVELMRSYGYLGHKKKIRRHDLGKVGLTSTVTDCDEAQEILEKDIEEASKNQEEWKE